MQSAITGPGDWRDNAAGVWGGTAEQRRAIRTAFAGISVAWAQLHDPAVAPDAAGYASRPVSG